MRRGEEREAPARASVPVWMFVVGGAGALGLLVMCCGGGAVGYLLLSPDRPRATGEAAPLASPVRRHEMPLATYLATRPPEPKLFSLRCQISSYYNYNYSNCKDTHYSINMRDTESHEILHGYAPKDSEAGRKLFAALEDGREHVLALRLQFGPANRSVRHLDIVGVD